MPVPNTFASATSAIPLANLDTNFATPITLGNTAVQLGNTVTTLGNVTLTNVNVSSGNVTVTNGTFSNTVSIVQSVGGTSLSWTDTIYDTGFLDIINQAARIRANNNLVFNTNGADRGRFDNSGNLLVGVTSTINSSKLTVSNPVNNAANFATASSGNYSLVCQNTGSGSTNFIIFQTGSGTTTVGSITTNGTTTAYNVTSDRRLKTNIEPLTNSGAIIDALLPRKFTWTSTNKEDLGFVTDEYQTVFPDAITGQPNATKEEEYEVTPAVKDEQGNITTPAVMGTRTVPVYQMGDFSTSAQIAVLVAEVQPLRARLKAANIA